MTQSNDNRIVANVVPGSTPIHSTVQSKDKPIQSLLGIVPSATTERKGIIRIAKVEEALEGISDDTAITPFTLKICTSTYIFTQAIASEVWVIEHNLDKFPSAFAVDSAGMAQMPNEIEYNDSNKLTLYFLAPFSGKAYLN